MSSERIRVFISVDPDAIIKRELYKWICILEKDAPSVKWVGAELLHFTLKFCGEISPVALEDICLALDRKFMQEAPHSFKTTLGAAGAFPSLEKARTLWIGLGKGKNSFVKLASFVEEGCVQAGIAEETREFHPHITIGRIKKSGDMPWSVRTEFADAKFESLGWTVSVIKLMRSVLTPGGPKYTTLKTYNLRS